MKAKWLLLIPVVFLTGVLYAQDLKTADVPTVVKSAFAIQQLPDEQRLIFNLRYFDEMPYETISEILKTSEGNLKANYHHAVKKIEAFIQNHSLNF